MTSVTGPALPSALVLTSEEFARITRLLRKFTGIELNSYTEYFQLIAGSDAAEERQIAIDLLTTNETYFFRETEHSLCSRR